RPRGHRATRAPSPRAVPPRARTRGDGARGGRGPRGTGPTAGPRDRLIVYGALAATVGTAPAADGGRRSGAVSAAPGPQPGGEQRVQVVDRDRAAPAEPPRPVGAAAEAFLHVLADSHVLQLDLVAELHALLREPASTVTLEIGKVEVDEHPTPLRPEREHDVG